jgi:hypothetical protein
VQWVNKVAQSRRKIEEKSNRDATDKNAGGIYNTHVRRRERREKREERREKRKEII